MMNVLIIEDEVAAARRLAKMVKETDPGAVILDMLESVAAAVSWFRTYGQPDLVMMDIHLADGSCFEIFKLVDVSCPVIFITAFDQYAIQAFKVNSIDYILKPVKQIELEASFRKLKNLHKAGPMPDLRILMEQLLEKPKSYHQRFSVKFGQYIKSLEINQIALFYAEEKAVFILTFENQRYPLDISLDKLEAQLDPSGFFRINRGVIINYHAISQMFTHLKGRIKIEPKVAFTGEAIVSAERASAFRDWINR
ncbi:MAG: LytTR family DNA-binding domain-containing protein [Bacteroidetes bacterium]|nr:LytTR family DNA-binding domain-containing protein [Bacteroidota bacterium]